MLLNLGNPPDAAIGLRLGEIMRLSRSMSERQSVQSGQLWDGGSADLSAHLRRNYSPESPPSVAQVLSADQIFLPLRLQFRSTTAADSIQEAYSLVLEFSTSPYYQQISPIRLPYLKAPEPGSKQENLAFPFIYKVMLSVQPKQPVPAVFNVTNPLCCRCTLLSMNMCRRCTFLSLSSLYFCRLHSAFIIAFSLLIPARVHSTR